MTYVTYEPDLLTHTVELVGVVSPLPSCRRQMFEVMSEGSESTFGNISSP